MLLQGKKINFLGDSITEGGGVSCIEDNFVSVFGRMSGAEVRNYGVGGTRIAKQKRPSREKKYDLDFIGRVEEMDADADIIVVFGGTNDYGSGDAAIGDISSEDEYTFYGALNVLCNKLIEKYPESTIVFMTPMHRLNENDKLNPLGYPHMAPLSVYVDAIKEVAAYYAFPVLDLYRTSGLQPNVAVIKDRYMPDGLHPNREGAKRIAERLFGFLSAL